VSRRTQAFVPATRTLLLALVASLVLAVAAADSAHAAPNTYTTLSAYAGGSSLIIDAAGNPVVAYRSALDTRLKMLRCNDPYCTGGGESLTSTDPQAGQWPSVTLDTAGYPVVAYYTTVYDKLKLLHCNDATCAGTETISTPDPGNFLLEFPISMVLDASGNPVIAYTPPYELRILHCNDPLCTGADESITVHDSNAGAPSMALDASGNPVVAYYKFSGGVFGTGQLRVMHCNDPNCAGGGETVTIPDGGPGIWPSLKLDASGFPVIAYYTGSTTRDLKVMHCNDVNCSGTNEATNTPDSNGDVGAQPSLALDGGHPRVSYRDETNGDLKLLRCNDADCAPGGDPIVSLDAAADSGERSSLRLDASGYPAVTFDSGSDLKLLRCGSSVCADGVGGLTELPVVVAPEASGLSSVLLIAIAAITAGAIGLAATLRLRRARR